MKYSLFLSMVLLTSLSGRENPFFALDPSKSKVSSNIVEAKEPLNAINYHLPAEARVLKEVTFTVQNLDGSVESKTLSVEKGLDWHRPLTIYQAGSMKGASTTSSSGSADFGFIKFSAQNKTLTVHTTDVLSRHFTLSDPNRIVLDFKRDTAFRGEEKGINAGIFKSVTLSNHNKFIRATILLDGIYSSEVKKEGSVIKIVCK